MTQSQAISVLELNCLVFGDDPGHIFPVEIAATKSVGALKEEIWKKKSPEFNHVAADKLVLWKVSFPDDENLQHILGTFEPVKRDLLQRSSSRLSTVFSTPHEDQHLHILIERPPTLTLSPLSSVAIGRTLALNCLVVGDDPSHLFPVEIASTKSVGALKKEIWKNKTPEFNHVAADKLVLRKVSFPDDDNLHQILATSDSVKGEVLRHAATKLHKVFSDQLEDEHLHILIERPPAVARPSAVGKIDLGEVSEWDVECLEQKQNTVLQSIRKAPVPSSSAKLSFLKDDPKGRPEGRPGVPIGVYHLAFTLFQVSFNDPSLEVSSKELTLTSQIIADSTAVYTNEKLRFVKLKPHLDKLLESEFINVETKDVKADGIITSQLSNGCLAIRALWELKNEIGCGGSDPATQVSYSYGKYWGSFEKDNIRSSSCCPSFLIAIAGPWICVLGAIFAEETIIQRLTDYVSLGEYPLHDTEIRRVARLFKSLSAGLKSLDVFYRNLKVVLPQQTVAVRLFPTICSYPISGGDVQFHYVSKLAANSVEKAVFKAKTNRDNRLIVVKFTHRYHERAHRVLADEGLAPKLFYVKRVYPSILVTHDFFNAPLMVVMEFVPGSPSNRIFGEAPISQPVFDRVCAAINVLHKRDIVFGDLRRPNIMVNRNQEVKLIDFDWCGKDGEARYPVVLNDTGEIHWHEEVARDSVMRKEHDCYMLAKLRPDAFLKDIAEESEPDTG